MNIMTEQQRADDIANDRRIDAYNNGALDALHGKTNAWPGDADYSEGYRQGLIERRVVVVMPRRPEGYYHAPIGTFD